MSSEFENGGSAEPSGEPWAPTAALQGRLGVGMWAALSSGGLALASTLTHRLQDQGVTLALALEWAALVPLIWVALAYVSLADGVGSSGLRKSALCVFGAYVLGELLTVADLPGVPGWVGFGVWVVLVIGLVALLVYVFSSSKEEEKPAGTVKPVDGETVAAPAEAEVATSTASKAGCAGALAVVAIGVLKFGAKVLVVLGIKNVGVELLQVLVGLGLIGTLIGFVVWFAVCKIRLRERLGGVAALVGWAELLLLAGCIILMTAMVSAVVAAAVADPDNAEKVGDDVFQQWLPVIVAFAGLGAVAWSVLTAWLFATLRSRPPAEDAAQL